MLNKKHITNIPILSDEWFMGRLAKFTASEWHYWMGEKPLTQGAINYTYRKVGEELSGLPARDEVDTKSTEWGKIQEPNAIKAFGEVMKLEFVVTQKLIVEPDSRFGCTPDFLISNSYKEDSEFWDVTPGEVKCPPSYDNFIALARCKTPADVKATNKIYYHQVLFQMAQCDCLRGFLVIFHPLFKSGGLKIIEFRKKDLIPDFKLLNERKIIAVNLFNEVREELLNLKY